MKTKKQQNMVAAEKQFNWKKRLYEKNWNGEEKIKTRGKLTITTFSMQQAGRDGGGWPLFPRLREGGQMARPT